jgi:hypothetical protein
MKEFKNQHDLFEHIWNTHEHVSEINGDPLLSKTHWQWIWQFAHVLCKKTYPYYKLKEENIMLMLPEQHEHQEQYDVYNEKKLELTQQYYKEFYSKEY